MTNNKKVIYFDLDGVIYDWNGAAFKAAQYVPSERQKLEIAEKFDVDKVIPTSELDLDDIVTKGGSEFWENLEQFDWANELVYKVHRSLPNVAMAFLTSVGRWQDAPKGKMRAVKRDWAGIPMIIAKEKWLCASPDKFLIDDKLSNIQKFREWGGYAFHWPNEFLLRSGRQSPQVTINLLVERLIIWDKGNEI